jgi:hypothetical protein
MLNPCIICNKPILSINLPPKYSFSSSASTVCLFPGESSNFRGFSYEAACCDACLDHLIQSKKLNINII